MRKFAIIITLFLSACTLIFVKPYGKGKIVILYPKLQAGVSNTDLRLARDILFNVLKEKGIDVLSIEDTDFILQQNGLEPEKATQLAYEDSDKILDYLNADLVIVLHIQELDKEIDVIKVKYFAKGKVECLGRGSKVLYNKIARVNLTNKLGQEISFPYQTSISSEYKYILLKLIRRLI